MKYIIFDSTEGPQVVLFCAPLTHRQEADAHPTWTPMSAGFLEFISPSAVRCFGRSDSLNLGCGYRDAGLI